MSDYLLLAIITLAYMTAWFIVSLIVRRNDVADIAWGLGFAVLTWVATLIKGSITSTAVIVAILVTIWAVRLSTHIYSRFRRKSEDERYARWRRSWGKWFVIRSFAQVFILQGALLFVIIQPVLAIILSKEDGVIAATAVGVLLWCVGFAFEVVGDWQLSHFLRQKKNKGKLMTRGLWRYSRHPNYFGEVLQWWALWVIALPLMGAWWTVIGPLTITILILKVSGIPLLEDKMSQYPDFETYKQQTSIFIPWKPKKI